MENEVKTLYVPESVITNPLGSMMGSMITYLLMRNGEYNPKSKSELQILQGDAPYFPIQFRFMELDEVVKKYVQATERFVTVMNLYSDKKFEVRFSENDTRQWNVFGGCHQIHEFSEYALAFLLNGSKPAHAKRVT